jgi:hypothetical protein
MTTAEVQQSPEKVFGDYLRGLRNRFLWCCLLAGFDALAITPALFVALVSVRLRRPIAPRALSAIIVAPLVRTITR